ncbi:MULTISPECIES: ABC transporter permease subunit [Lentilactobacillus]|uniref:Amino acid ABC superfamily ATP binding cassette transporter, membrane protein n=2 Tax=Lentilactobacillus kefiri TaxID=33962 RepID=A0A8E1RK15_LENKE|nr:MULTISPECIES: ABC transporter permease subunit [Lentilactobacillus]KRL73778.1 amino acid ABC superfamily ATP binding cassette transporter, membrane protein [Lentilactobacillus parakefiri DSM 10551]KRM53062.1 amino acid ABC superfamily ATP binding cassette transporter, membrane protein [Lentilactobacillus kefiri DSM 20587 = JCM 5818]MBW0223862.1 ABC transporter permease subunit [Lentilactobacillus parabuchneri]OCB81552.1 amino acid ABC transporter permease [Lentilactobacillus parabuchneri]GE
MKVIKILAALVGGLPNTITLLIASFIFSSLIGIGVAFLSLQDDKVGKSVSRVYIGLVRGTPPLLMLLLTYYGLPKLLSFIGIDSNNWAKIIFGIFGLSVGWGGYMAEAFRSAYLSVDEGQIKAAYSVGMTGETALREIILPQAFLIAIPNVENLLIGLLKATSLVYVIGLADMYQNASNLSNVNQGVYQLKIFIILALIYWILASLIEWGFRTYQSHFAHVEA